MLLSSLVYSLHLQLAGIVESAFQVNDLILVKTHLNIVAWYTMDGTLNNRYSIHDACHSSINSDGSWSVGTPEYTLSGSNSINSPFTIPGNGCKPTNTKLENNSLIVKFDKYGFKCDDHCTSYKAAKIPQASSDLEVTFHKQEYKFGEISIKSHCEIKSAFKLSDGYLTVKRCGSMSFLDKQGKVKWAVEQGMTNAIDSFYFEQAAPKAMKSKLEHEDILSALFDRYVTHFKVITGQMSFETVKQKNLELILILSGPENPTLYVLFPDGSLNRKIMLFNEKGLESFISNKIYRIGENIVVTGKADDVSTIVVFEILKGTLSMQKIISSATVLKKANSFVISTKAITGNRVLETPKMVIGESLLNGKWEPIFKMPVPDKYTLIKSAEIDPNEQIAKYVVQDEIKFAPPHLKAYLWQSQSELILWAIDGKTGRSFIYATISNAQGPFTLAMSENFVYLTYVSIETGLSVGVIYEMLFSNTPENWTFADVESPKIKMRQVFIEKGPFTTSTITQTQKGVAYRDIIVYSAYTGQVMKIQKALVDLSSYQPNQPDAFNFNPLNVLSNNLYIKSLKSIAALRESQSHIVGFGGDIFHRKTHPSGSFDEIPDNFDKNSVQVGMLVLILGYLGSIYYSKSQDKKMQFE